MAEKYGTVPPRFTSAWWEYFWMYYKAYVLTALFIIVLACVTIYQFVTAPKYDLTVAFAGNVTLMDEAAENVVQIISPLCEDVDKNGEKSIYLQQLNTNADVDMEYAIAMSQKFDLMLAEDDIYIYILDESMAKRNIGKNPDESAYAPLQDWFTEDYSTLGTYTENGTVYGIRLTDCAIFKEISQKTKVDFSDKYLFIRYFPRKDQIKSQLKGYEAAVRLANKIIKG